jgi:tetratricopeptide (TPR) repeat protein
MFDEYNLYFNTDDDQEEELYPDFFYEWDESMDNGRSPGYYEPEMLEEIIEIYLEDDEYPKAKKTIDYALKVFPDDEEMIYDILMSLYDTEKWNDLLSLSEKYENMPDVWPDGHRLAALLHLGMEEDAFLFFGKMKTKYAENEEDLSVIYQAMGEALCDMALYDASLEVIEEALHLLGDSVDFHWIELQCYLSMDEKEKMIETGEIIAKTDPFDCEAWHRLGIAYQEVGDPEKAIDAFEFARNLGFKDKNNLIYLIQTYEQNGNFHKALEYAVEYLKYYPDNYLINFLASNICSQMEMWKEAIGFLDKAIRITPHLDALYMYKCTYLLRLGEQKKAKLVLKEGIKNTKDPEKDLSNELKRLNDLYPNI